MQRNGHGSMPEDRGEHKREMTGRALVSGDPFMARSGERMIEGDFVFCGTRDF
jgi:hypothetical protein